mmetsp:Transcript_102976/g.245259  ORF Transcript_102976/g.245259 Transcript_102976/m.245259 type:complete len:299 (-) Transcript_102976:183-1079(-)
MPGHAKLDGVDLRVGHHEQEQHTEGVQPSDPCRIARRFVYHLAFGAFFRKCFSRGTLVGLSPIREDQGHEEDIQTGARGPYEALPAKLQGCSSPTEDREHHHLHYVRPCGGPDLRQNAAPKPFSVLVPWSHSGVPFPEIWLLGQRRKRHHPAIHVRLAEEIPLGLGLTASADEVLPVVGNSGVDDGLVVEELACPTEDVPVGHVFPGPERAISMCFAHVEANGTVVQDRIVGVVHRQGINSLVPTQGWEVVALCIANPESLEVSEIPASGAVSADFAIGAPRDVQERLRVEVVLLDRI